MNANTDRLTIAYNTARERQAAASDASAAARDADNAPRANTSTRIARLEAEAAALRADLAVVEAADALAPHIDAKDLEQKSPDAMIAFPANVAVDVERELAEAARLRAQAAQAVARAGERIGAGREALQRLEDARYTAGLPAPRWEIPTVEVGGVSPEGRAGRVLAALRAMPAYTVDPRRDSLAREIRQVEREADTIRARREEERRAAEERAQQIAAHDARKAREAEESYQRQRAQTLRLQAEFAERNGVRKLADADRARLEDHHNELERSAL